MERHLELAAAEWAASEHDPSFLYRAGHLERYERWKRSSDTRLTDIERQFLDDGREAEDRHKATARSRRRRVLAAVSSLAVLALVLAAIAVVQRNEAQNEAALADASAEDALEAAFLADQASRQAEDAELVAEDRRVEADEARAEADVSRGEAVGRAFDAETDRLVALSSSLADQDRRAAILLAMAVYQRDPSPATLGALQESLVNAAPVLQHLARGTAYLDVEWATGDRVVATRSDGIDLIDLQTGDIVDSISTIGAFRIPDHKRAATDDSGTVLALMTDVPDDNTDLFDLASVSAYRIGADGFEELFEQVPLGAVGLNIAMSPAGDMIVATGATQDESVVRALAEDGTELWEARFPRPATMFDQVEPVLGNDFSDADAFKTSLVGAFTTVTEDQVFIANGAWLHRLDHDGERLGDRIFVQGEVVVPDETPGARVVFDMVETDSGWYAFDSVGGMGFVAREGGWPERLVIDDVDAARATVGSSSNITARVVVDDRVIATQGDGSLVRFDLASGAPLSTTELQIGRPASLSLAPGQDRVAIAHSSGVTIVSLDDSGPLAAAVPRKRNLIVLPISTDGTLAVLSPPGRPGGPPVEIWNVGPDGPTLDTDIPIDELAVYGYFLANESLLGIRLPGVVNLEIAYSLETGNEEWRWEEAPTADAESFIADSPDGPLRLFGGIDDTRNVDVYRLGEFVKIRVLESSYRTEGFDQQVLGLAFDSTRDRLLVADSDGYAELWDLGTWTRIDDDHLATLDITLGTWSSDGSLVATAAPDGTISIRDGETFEALDVLTGAGHITHPHPLIFSPDNSLLLTAFDGSGRLWDVETGSQIGTEFPQVAGTIAGMNVNEDGLMLMTASEQSALIWNLDTSTWADIACKVVGSNLTADEWEQWGQRDTERYAICPEFPLPD
jgi:WD40 repeat protein